MTRQAKGVIQITAIGTIINALTGADTDPDAGWGQVMDALNLITGVEDGQFNRAIYKANVALASGSSMSLDVFDFAGFDAGAGDGKDLLGQQMALDEIVAIIVYVRAGSDGGLVIGNDGTGASLNSIFDGTDTGKIGPIRATALMPGIFLLFSPSVDGWEVNDATNHILKFQSVAGALNFDLVILGRENP